MEEFICRVCGYEYDTPTWNDQFDATFDFCICCNVEFGIQDTHYNGAFKYRMDWINNGAIWSAPKWIPKD